MKINVRLNGNLARTSGMTRLQIMLTAGATVQDLLAQMRIEHPSTANGLSITVPFVAGKHAALTDVLRDGQEVALLQPVAGGDISFTRPEIARD